MSMHARETFVECFSSAIGLEQIMQGFILRVTAARTCAPLSLPLLGSIDPVYILPGVVL